MRHPLLVEGYAPADAADGETILEACEAHGIPLESACGGFAACNSCRVAVIDGADRLSPLLDEEVDFLDAPGQRLGCQAFIHGPVRVRIAAGM